MRYYFCILGLDKLFNLRYLIALQPGDYCFVSIQTIESGMIWIYHMWMVYSSVISRRLYITWIRLVPDAPADRDPVMVDIRGATPLVNIYTHHIWASVGDEQACVKWWMWKWLLNMSFPRDYQVWRAKRRIYSFDIRTNPSFFRPWIRDMIIKWYTPASEGDGCIKKGEGVSGLI
jgi:hypothetical protein